MKRYDIIGYDNHLSELEDGEWVRHDDAQAAITAAVEAERAKWSAFADEKGEPRKVDGTLPIINGVIVGSFTTVFARDPIEGVVELRTRWPALVGTTSLGPIPEYHDWRTLHLTREAAESTIRLCYPFSMNTCDDPKCSCRIEKAESARIDAGKRKVKRGK